MRLELRLRGELLGEIPIYWGHRGREGGRDGGTEGRRDGGTEGRRDGGTEGRRDGGTEGRRDGGDRKSVV